MSDRIDMAAVSIFRCTLCLTVMLVLAAVASGQTVIQPLNLTLCKNSSMNVGRFKTDVFVVQPQQHESCSSLTNITSTPVLLRVVSRAEEPSRPVVFVSRSIDSVQTWKIPLKLQLFSQLFYSVERTLCSVSPLPLSQWEQEEGEVIIDVFTSSTSGENYTIEVTPVEDAVLSLNQPVELNVSVNAPEVRYFKFPSSVSSVLVQASSSTTEPNNGCIIVSVQNYSCPVNDLHQNALSKGVYQTMLSSASLPIIANTTVNGSEFFLVILVTHTSVCDPGATMNIINNTHNVSLYYTHKVNVTITELSEAQSNLAAIFLPVAVFLVISFIIVVFFLVPCPSFLTHGYSPLHWLCEIYHKHKSDATSQSAINDTESHCSPPRLRKGKGESGSLLSAPGQSYGSMASNHGAASMAVTCSDVKEEEDRDKHEEEDYEFNETNELLKSGSLRSVLDEPERKLYLTRLMRKNWKSLVSDYRVYGWNAITVGIFYGLPAFQLVLGQQLNVDSSGNMDQCYYNFKCAHPFGVLSAFNNVWSNIGYFVLGVAFFIIVFIRHCKAERYMAADRVKYCSHGVPQFYGLYYAMGFALILEGFMSSFYHICPSEYNFQFDTAFMFIIGGLLTVKVLQARHPDINANAFIAFFCFAVVIFLTMIGIYESQTAPLPTRITLVVFILLSMILFFLSFYYYHDWRVGYFVEKTKWIQFFKFIKSFSHRSFLPRHKIRCIKLSIVLIFNIILGACMIAMGKNAPTIVLGLFVATFMSLLFAYVLFKIYHMEPWTLASIFHLVMVGLCWLSAFYFYANNVSDWALSPSESRGLNKPCLFLFYDNHDVWHFLSACAMFFSFLFLLTLDDGLNDTPTNKINIF